MTGHRWTGEIHDWKQAPDQYGAIHFHDDDIYDCGWEADFALTVPEQLESGIYAARIRAGDHEDRIPFVVKPPRGAAGADALFLMPSASYMAYANEHSGSEGGGLTQALMNHTLSLPAHDLLLNERPDLGYSLYDLHSDGSGVCYGSRLRPVLNFRPCVTNSWVGAAGTIAWQFNADLPLVDWLEAASRGRGTSTMPPRCSMRPRTGTCAPTWRSSRRRTGARCSRSAPSRGWGASRGTASTTMSPASPATCCAGSSTPRRSRCRGAQPTFGRTSAAKRSI